ncbi:hypothetical protein EON71_00930 [bacterium]|nr:MAG: hypothetical protein EON71_00930 [bacterium]
MSEKKTIYLCLLHKGFEIYKIKQLKICLLLNKNYFGVCKNILQSKAKSKDYWYITKSDKDEYKYKISSARFAEKTQWMINTNTICINIFFGIDEKAKHTKKKRRYNKKNMCEPITLSEEWDDIQIVYNQSTMPDNLGSVYISSKRKIKHLKICDGAANQVQKDQDNIIKFEKELKVDHLNIRDTNFIKNNKFVSDYITNLDLHNTDILITDFKFSNLRKLRCEYVLLTSLTDMQNYNKLTTLICNSIMLKNDISCIKRTKCIILPHTLSDLSVKMLEDNYSFSFFGILNKITLETATCTILKQVILCTRSLKIDFLARNANYSKSYNVNEFICIGDYLKDLNINNCYFNSNHTAPNVIVKLDLAGKDLNCLNIPSCMVHSWPTFCKKLTLPDNLYNQTTIPSYFFSWPINLTTLDIMFDYDIKLEYFNIDKIPDCIERIYISAFLGKNFTYDFSKFKNLKELYVIEGDTGIKTNIHLPTNIERLTLNLYDVSFFNTWSLLQNLKHCVLVCYLQSDLIIDSCPPNLIFFKITSRIKNQNNIFIRNISSSVAKIIYSPHNTYFQTQTDAELNKC